ncbi:MAG: phosphoenolpyruvate--protein phosphotransferase [Clostridia bacterium]|nr:phosphoenolpyruvate--protein phosphotransferase [Clostridia bacterium]
MKELIGIGVSNGIAIGNLHFYDNTHPDIPDYEVDNPDKELLRYRSSMKMAKKKLQEIYDSARKKVSKRESVIFQTHIMILEDSKFVELVESYLSDKKNAEYAVFHAANRLANIFKQIDDEYFKSRCNDIIDAAHILIDILQQKPKTNITYEGGDPVIIAAPNLLPSDTVSFNEDKLLGFITNDGSQNSHTAIIARTMGIPSVVKIDEHLEDFNGMQTIIDGQLGKVIIDPDKNTIALYSAKRERYYKQQQRLIHQLGLPSETKNKQYIRLSADMGKFEEIEKAKSNDAEGVGIFRSEVLFMSRGSYPDEDAQFEAYKTIIRSFPDKQVVINTVNGGSEKGISYLDIPKERNPALGFKGIRISLENPEFFKTQLRALYRASIYGKLGILLPMVSSLEEIEYVKREIEGIKSEMRLKGEMFSEDVRLGVMIETPAAALISYEICEQVDFVTINTDNLTQYTLAMDRENQKLADFFRPYHPAVKRLIQMTVNNAHLCGKQVSICGELASDTAMTELFLALGVDELAMIPSKILNVKAAVREADTTDSSKLLRSI